MAQTTQKLQIIIDAENRTNSALRSVNKNLDSVQTKIKSMQPAFKKMALVGGIAFGALAFGVKEATQLAAEAEGSYAKFNTVFGENSENMLAFINDIRKEMPLATSQIVRMTADMQDLLVPLGLSRGLATDMSKGFLDVANKIAAFNDVDPTEVLEAIKSGLSGSSEPLKRFGVNALETALETRAMKDGLLEAGQSFKDLEPDVKNQIRAQALLAQVIDNSSDAINGFEENNDSFIRRQQALNATIIETKEKIGNLLLPIFDSLLKKILPIVEKVGDWIEANPELTKKIIIAVAAIAGLVLVVGLLGLALPVIIAGFGILLGPIGLVGVAIALLIAFVVLIVKNFSTARDAIVGAWNSIAEATIMKWEEIKTAVTNAWQSIVNAIVGAVELTKGALVSAWQSVMNAVIAVFNVFIQPFKNIFNFIVGLLELALNAMGTNVKFFIESVGETLLGLWNFIADLFTEYTKIVIEIIINWVNIIKDIIILLVDGLKFIWQTLWDFYKSIVEVVWGAILKVILIAFEKIREIFNKAKETIGNLWQGVWDGILNIVGAMIDKVKAPITSLIDWFKDKIEIIKNLASSVGRAVSGAVGKIGGFIGDVVSTGQGVTNVNDAIITPDGKIIKTNPADFIIATKNPGALGGRGVNVNITINGDVSGSELVEKVKQAIMFDLKQNIKLS